MKLFKCDLCGKIEEKVKGGHLSLHASCEIFFHRYNVCKECFQAVWSVTMSRLRQGRKGK
jgi:hypothetical protein